MQALTPEARVALDGPLAAGPPAARRRLRDRVGPVAFWSFGVALPLATIGIEAVCGWSAQEMFDPIPTPLHVLLCLLVPLGQWLAWRARRGPGAPSRLALAANGAAVGVSAFYTVLYGPLLPLGVVFIVYFGFGLLPLTPVLSLATAAVMRRRLKRRARAAGVPAGMPFWGAAAGALALLVALDLPRTVTRVAAGFAAEGGPAERSTALAALRSLGSREALLRMSYVRTSMGMDLLGSLLAPHVTPQQARTLFFRVTGQPFNSVPPPRVRPMRGDPFGFGRDGNPDQGGREVAGVVEKLALSSSRIDGSVDAQAALAYLEWTLEFRNDSADAQEARVQVALPPGAVVSRLTLWIDGQEREAAFGTRAQTRGAYETVVVRQRRDPVLVTTAGRDRVLLQCFPVPAGGTMKTRVGITAPLDLRSLGEGRLVLPRLVERNFQVPQELRHSVWVEGTGAVTGAGLVSAPREGVASLWGALSDRELLAETAALTIARDAALTETWTVDAHEPEHPATVRQRFATRERAAAHVVVVVDGSVAAQKDAPAIGRALTQAAPGTIVSVLLAGDDLLRFNDPAGRGGSWGAQLERAPFVGGQDNVPALEAAWDEAEAKGAVVLWIHGPQPVALSSVDALRQRWERRPGGPRLLLFALAPGANRVVEALDGIDAVSAPAREGAVETDLARLLASWAGPTAEVTVARTRAETAPPGAAAARTSDHLVRLWARDEVLRLAAAPDTLAQAGALATGYRLVTPVSGAVVLETAAQYEAANLTPGTTNVPTIPEPETWALVVLALAAAAYASRRRSRWTAA